MLGVCFLLEGRLRYLRFVDDFSVFPMTNTWLDLGGPSDKTYVVQTTSRVIERCILMASDPGDLVLDPTCASGTAAYVAEQWGRRWITIDTSRVALALARARVMGARYPYYLLVDSPDGQQKVADLTRREPSSSSTHGDVRQGFVYQRAPHIQLRDIANNAEIDVIYEQMQPHVDDALTALNSLLRGRTTPYIVEVGGRSGQHVDFTAPPGASVKLPSGEEAPANALLEWEAPHAAPSDWPSAAIDALARLHDAQRARQRELDASITAKAEFEYLYDKPYADGRKVRVAGPFYGRESLATPCPRRRRGRRADRRGRRDLRAPTVGRVTSAR